MTDGYRVIRAETLAWLLERHRTHTDGEVDVPIEIARDLGEVVVGVEAVVDEDRIKMTGPLLSVEEHEELLIDQLKDLPRDRHAGEFWRLVLKVVHAVLTNEAEWVRRLLADRRDK